MSRFESFDDVEGELDGIHVNQATFNNQLGDLNGRVPDMNAAIAEFNTAVSNMSTRLLAVEDRLTAREIAYNSLASQLSDMIAQMQVKLQSTLELKPEIMPYDNELAAGVIDQVTGLKLRADGTAQRKFTGLLVWANEGLEQQMLALDTFIAIWDYSGVKTPITIDGYKKLMVRYGLLVAAIEDKY